MLGKEKAREKRGNGSTTVVASKSTRVVLRRTKEGGDRVCIYVCKTEATQARGQGGGLRILNVVVGRPYFAETVVMQSQEEA